MECPHCNVTIKDGSKICPYCGKVITEKNIKDISNNIKEPNKIKIEELLDKTREIVLKDIPLKIKKTVGHKNKEENKTKIKSTITIILVIVLLIFNIYFITKIVADKEETSNATINTKINLVSSKSTKIGNWKTGNNSIFSFQDDLKFFWFEDLNNSKAPYYEGTYKYVKGENALVEMGYTKEEFSKTFKNIEIENTYSIHIKPTSLKNSINDEDNTREWWYILLIKDDKKGIAYNKTLDLRYELEKYK